jgi:hypothetical protein
VTGTPEITCGFCSKAKGLDTVGLQWDLGGKLEFKLGVPYASIRSAPMWAFSMFVRMLPCGLGCGQVVDKNGERGRNRTFNLLIPNQQPKTNGFNDFPNHRVGRSGRF